MYHIVYKTINNVNGKIYIGIHSTKDIDDGYLGSGKAFLLAYKKYGRPAFSREILHYCDTRQEALDIEAEIVNEDFISESSNYNMKTGGEQSVKYSDELKRKLSICKTGKLNPMYGTALSKEHKQKIRESNIGRKPSTETIEKIRIANLGKVMSDDQLVNVRKHLSKLNSRQKGESHPSTGRKHTEEAKCKMSKAKEGYVPINKGVKCEIVTCPHCGKSGGLTGMRSWHFTHCKHNPNGSRKEHP